MTVVVVTGAASGMGRAAALRFAAQGATVVAIDLDATGLDALRTEAGEAIEPFVAAVDDEDATRAWAQATAERHAAVDGLFANAGIPGARRTIAETDFATWQSVLSINVGGMLLAIKHVAPLLRRPGGAIVATASTASHRGQATRSDYVASKHAILGLVKCAALELAPEGIRVNCICPGPIETAMLDKHAGTLADDPGEARRIIDSVIPLSRRGTAEEVASLVDFLLFGDSGYITGGAFTIDGGYLAG